MAKWTPSSSRPGASKSRSTREPIATTTASVAAASSSASTLTPTWAPYSNFTPSASSSSTRRSIIHFSSFASGTPNRISPPGASSRSWTVTVCPTWLSSAAAASPAGPEPMTAIERPVRCAGWRGTIQPSSKPRWTIAYSICLIITGSSSIARTHADSHGAGQIRPVNSGKLLVACSWSHAARQSSRRTRSFQSGIRLPSGQAELQNGTPQSMQRAPWRRSSSTGRTPKISP